MTYLLLPSHTTHIISAFALFTTKPMDILYPLQKAAEQGVHVETLVGETLAH